MTERRFHGIGAHAVRQLLVAAVLIAGLVCLIAGGRAQAAGPSRADAGQASERRAFVTHRGRNWSWAGPRNWTASYGTYGITIFGPGRALDLGFSSTFCSPGNTARQSANNWMADRRRDLRRSGVRIRSTTRIRRVRSFGPNYFRQIVRGTSNGGRSSGLAIFDYEVARYCYQRSVAMGAPTRGFNRSLRTLFRIFNSLAYFGPGAYENGDGVHGT